MKKLFIFISLIPSLAFSLNFTVKEFEVRVVSSDGVPQNDFLIASDRDVKVLKHRRSPDGLWEWVDTILKLDSVKLKTETPQGGEARAIFPTKTYSKDEAKKPTVDIAIEGLRYCDEYTKYFMGQFKEGQVLSKKDACYAVFDGEANIERIPAKMECILKDSSETVKKLREHAKKVCEKRTIDIQLLEAIYENIPASFENALAEGANPNTVEIREKRSVENFAIKGYSAILLALYAPSQRDQKMAETLLNHKDFIPNVGDILSVVALNGDWNFVEKLLEKGEDPNQRGHRETTPLLETIYQAKLPQGKKDYVATVKVLLKGGADKNLKNLDGHTPLSKAKELLNDPHARYPEAKEVLKEIIALLESSP